MKITVVGTAWFSKFSIEKGVQDKSSEWNFALFICENLDVDIEKNGEQQNVRTSMTKDDVNTMVVDMKRFQNSIKTLSGNQMTAKINIYKLSKPITTLSYDEENGYFIAPKDVENLIDDTILQENFDHIFIVAKYGDNFNQEDDVPVKDWIGLGYMDYYGLGFSVIRIPNNENIFYEHDSDLNKFPEEVYVHEFLHSLERELNERDYNIPELHSYRKYGYKNSLAEGQKDWYRDYMQKKIYTDSGYIGLDSAVYTIKPVKESCFINAIKLNYFDEPRTVFGEIGKLFSTLF